VNIKTKNQFIFTSPFHNRACCVARSAFGRRAEPEHSEGGGARSSAAVPNGEGVASGGATWVLKKICGIKPKKAD